MYSEKSFCYSLIWKELSENVSIALYKTLEKRVVLFTSDSLKMSVGSNSMKVSVLIDMKSEKVFAIVGSNWLKV